ncbi:MAG: hypothetical protein AAF399_13400 [Bacteroidota bacterium]
MMSNSRKSNWKPMGGWRSLPRFLMLAAMLGSLAITAPSCKNKKKLAEEAARAAAAEKARQINDAREDLQALMSTPVRDMRDLNAREDALAEIKGRNVDDPGIRALIADVEDFLAAERDRLEVEARPPEPQPQPEPMAQKKRMLDQAFSDIAAAGSTSSANSRIQQVMQEFASPSTPVLIIINQSNGVDDYDRPTTIEKYLNYLKDRGRNPNQAYEIRTNSSGRISELVLLKR